MYTCAYCKNSTNPTNPDCEVNIFPFNHLVIFENVYGTVNFDTDRLASLCFYPMEYIQRAGKFNDLDSDSNFSRSSSTCDYFVVDQLNNLTAARNDNDLSVLHLNARSLYVNFEKFNQILGWLDHSFSVIGVTETWLNEATSDLVNIPGYN